MLTCFQSWSQRIISAFLVLVVSVNTKAQTGELLPELDQFSGLQSNGVRCIKIDPKGRVWVGTDNGLNILNTITPIEAAISNTIGNNSVWAIDYKENIVFIGTRNNGLYQFNRLSGKLIKHYPSSTINLIRKIKVLDNRIFILTNGGAFEVVGTDLQKLNLTNSAKSDFLIDIFQWNNALYGVRYYHQGIIRLNGVTFNKNETELFLGKDFKHKHLTIFSVATYNNRLYLGAMDLQPFLIVIEKDKPPVTINFFDSPGSGYIIWDIAVAKDKIILGIGDVYSNKKGLVYILNSNSINQSPVKVKNYVTCVVIDSLNNSIYYGTLDKGLHFQNSILASSFKNDPAESEFVKKRDRSKFFDKWTHSYSFGDTLVLAHENKIELYNQQTGKQLFSISKDKRFPYLFSNSIQFLNNSIYTFDNYGWIYKYNLIKKNGWAVEKIESSLPYPQKFGSKIILLNKEKGFNIITESESYPLHCSDKGIPFVIDFTLIHDTLYTLSKNTLKAFRIDEQKKELIFLKEYDSPNAIEGFSPKWILSQADKLYLLNENAILNINVNNGQPIHYYYWGNYVNLKKPMVEGDSLTLAYDGILHNIPFVAINYSGSSIQTADISLSLPSSVNENLGFKIGFNSPDYLVQNRYLKSLEIWRRGRLKEIKYSTTSTFDFTKGLQFGDYDLIFKVGSIEKKANLNVTLPLNRNPYFFGSLTLFVFIIILLLLKSRYDKKELNKKLSENRMQVLKQNLNPHFVYNSMNLINSLILEEKYDDAVQVVSEFSKLQRTFLETNNREVISLKEEFDFLEVYLRLQQRRFHYDNSFTYSINVTNGIDANTIMIPPLILQPLVENAIKHGIIGSEKKAPHISITVSGINPLLISVEDNGNGASKGGKELGMGHKLITERINLFNADRKHKLIIEFDKQPINSHSGYRIELSYTKPN